MALPVSWKMAVFVSRTIRPSALSERNCTRRRNWTFAGSQRRADRAAITTCRLNDVDPKAWLADVFARIADLPISRLHELLPWQWKSQKGTAIAAVA
ncbi:Mobile element protein (plasmid) [Sinorhizobium sp. CCBAU 05631]|nr:Mobile element protein [Sinorhizobium sp. CCBAU 05631]